MDKKRYETPEMALVLIAGEDIVRTSGIDQGETED